jgi:uncharacterized protein
MPLRMREISLTLQEDEATLPLKVAREIGIDPAGIENLRIVRRGIDARKKPKVLRVYTVEFCAADEEGLLTRNRNNAKLESVQPPPHSPIAPIDGPLRVVVVGMGPAGLFAALQLARRGASVTLLEQGKKVEDRVRDVRRFWREGVLDPHSNVQFGEGGAGTFSDGKLTTRLNHPWTHLVLQTLVEFGAPEEILSQAKPHVGTDRLRLVLINFRRTLADLGVDLRYGAKLSGLCLTQNRVRGGVLQGGEEIPCDCLVLAPGHSARDTYEMLEQNAVRLEPKPFAIGLRVEHPASLINSIQYGSPSHPKLPAADYALAWNDPQTGRGVYSFCMCPGGEIVNSASEPGALVVNGMSGRRRDGEWSNSALVVSVRPDDFGGGDPLAGVRFQRLWEVRAFEAGGSDFRAPAQSLTAFLGGRGPLLHSTCRPGVREADLRSVLPDFVVEGLLRALPHFERRMRGFLTDEAVLVGVETRTSAPLRIVRGEDGQSVSHAGLFPAGEGAGYAGGIMSAALDGLRAAQHVAVDAAEKRRYR